MVLTTSSWKLQGHKAIRSIQNGITQIKDLPGPARAKYRRMRGKVESIRGNPGPVVLQEGLHKERRPVYYYHPALHSAQISGGACWTIRRWKMAHQKECLQPVHRKRRVAICCEKDDHTLRSLPSTLVSYGCAQSAHKYLGQLEFWLNSWRSPCNGLWDSLTKFNASVMARSWHMK